MLCSFPNGASNETSPPSVSKQTGSGGVTCFLEHGDPTEEDDPEPGTPRGGEGEEVDQPSRRRRSGAVAEVALLQCAVGDLASRWRERDGGQRCRPAARRDRAAVVCGRGLEREQVRRALSGRADGAQDTLGAGEAATESW